MSFPANFEQVLKDFFFKKHPRMMAKIPSIISEFKGQEKEVMLLLCKKYKVDPNTIEGINSYTTAVVEPPAVEAPQEEPIEEIAPAEKEEVEATNEESTEEGVSEESEEEKEGK